MDDPVEFAKSFYPIRRKHSKAVLVLDYLNRDIQTAKSFDYPGLQNPYLYPFHEAISQQVSFFESVDLDSLAEKTRAKAGYESVLPIFLVEGMDLRALPNQVRASYDESLRYGGSDSLRLPLDRYFNFSGKGGSSDGPNLESVKRECAVSQKDFSFEEIRALRCKDSEEGRKIRNLVSSWQKYETFRSEQERKLSSIQGKSKDYDIIILGLKDYGPRADNSWFLLPFSILTAGVIPFYRDHARFIVTYVYEGEDSERFRTFLTDLRQLYSTILLPFTPLQRNLSPKGKLAADGFFLLDFFLSKDDYYMPSTSAKEKERTPLWTETGEIHSLSNGKVQIRHKGRLRPGSIVYPSRDEGRSIRILTSSHTYVEGISENKGRLSVGEKVYSKRMIEKEEETPAPKRNL